jgi:hypothetical protein
MWFKPPSELLLIMHCWHFDGPWPARCSQSTPRINKIINRCNHFQFEEDDQFNSSSTAVSRMIVSLYVVGLSFQNLHREFLY